MSEVYRDNLEEERRLININSSDAQEVKTAKRKKMIKYGVIIGGVVVLAVVAIVLGVVLSKKDDDKPGPGPGPGPDPPTPHYPDPLKHQEMNNYGLVKETDYQVQDWYVNAILKMNPKPASLATNLMEDGHTYRPVDPSKIPNDVNNKFAE